MDFFTHQELARRSSRRLVVLFALAVLSLIAALYLATLAVLGAYGAKTGHHLAPAFSDTPLLEWIWQPRVAFWTATFAIVFIAGGSTLKIIELAQGGSAVASALGGRPVDPRTEDPDERRLVNVVEEMAIASGIPVPDIYLLTEERGINAFAAGRSVEDAAIGITQGALRAFNRDELQGVVAHEFSHILNGDMRLNLRLMGWLHGIVGVATIGYFVLRIGAFSGSGRGNNRGGNLPIAGIGLALLVIGWTGVFFGRLIKSAVSRQREFLADASAVQFTRHPAGIAGALKKIGGLSAHARIRHPYAEEASHLFFGSAVSSWFQWMATHPPLIDRVRRIEPGFQGPFEPFRLPPKTPSPAQEETTPGPEKPRMVFPFPTPEGLATAAAGLHAGLQASEALRHAGNPVPVHVAFAKSLLESLPAALREAAHEPADAVALILGLLISNTRNLRAEQLAYLEAEAPPAVTSALQEQLPHIGGLERRQKLPLLELAVPALRHLAPEQYAAFRNQARHLIESDREIDLFEFTLLKCLEGSLDPHYGTRKSPAAHFYAMRPLLDAAQVLLSGLAHIGHDSADARLHSYESGVRILDREAVGRPILDSHECRLEAIEKALQQLALASPPLRKRILQACATVVATDQRITDHEAELLRAIAYLLGCPLPPVIHVPAPPPAS